MPASLLNLSNLITVPGTGLRGIAQAERSMLLFNDFDAMGTTPNWKDTYTLVQYGDLLIEDCYLPKLARITPTGGYTFETPPTERAWREELGREVNVLRVDKLAGAGSGPSMPPKPGYQPGILTKNGVCLQDRGLDLLELGPADGMLTIGGKSIDKLRLNHFAGKFDTSEIWEIAAELLARPHSLSVQEVEKFFSGHGSTEDVRELYPWHIAEESGEWTAYQWEDLR